MTPELPQWLVAIAGIAAIALLVAVTRAAMIPANRLGISVFRPYRGDPWPVGVQEDDDVRFRWTRTGPSRAAAEAPVDDPLDGVAARPPERRSIETAERARVEDIATVDLEVRPLRGGDVHRVRR